MPVTARERRRLLICLAVALAIGALTAASSLYWPIPYVQDAQQLLNDAIIFKNRGGADRATRVALVHVDEKSVAALKDQYGRFFSWPRTLHARVLRNLADARARVVAYDVLFDAPGCPTTAPRPCGEDLALAEAIAYAAGQPSGGTKVVLPVLGSPAVMERGAPGQPLRFRDVVGPIPELARQAAALAHIHPEVDRDGAVRRLTLLVEVQGREVPALSLQAAALHLRRPAAVDAKGRGFVAFAGRTIPTDDYYRVTINFLGIPSHLAEAPEPGPVPTVSFVDVLNGTFDAEVVRDKTVFVGLTAFGFADDFIVPTSPGIKMSGVEIIAQAAEMILRGAYLEQQSPASTAVVTLVLAIVPGVLLARFQPFAAAGATLIVFLAYFTLIVIYGLRSEASLDEAQNFTVLNSVYPGLAMLAASIAIMLYRIVFEQAEQRATRRAMGMYLSPAVLHEVLKDPASLRLGGQKREMSVLFADIRGFTPVSEGMDPTELVQFLNEYLTEMTDIVFRNEGVLDKYMGDEIMAFWGAPTVQPDHAARACRTAYQMLRRLRELQPRWTERGLPPLTIGVGINTGQMTAGNVGSRLRFDYTVVGDAVNLASRLEGVNREYGTDVVISDATLAHVRCAYVVRFLDRIAVQGRSEPTGIYELLAPAGEAARLSPQALQIWQDAIALYQAQRFVEAEAAFARVLCLVPDDGPALTFVARCRRLQAAPPGTAWDGVHAMSRK